MSDNLQVILVRVESAEYITLCVGLFLVLVGFLGCCGAAKDSKWMLQLFITVLIILILGLNKNYALLITSFIFFKLILSVNSDFYNS